MVPQFPNRRVCWVSTYHKGSLGPRAASLEASCCLCGIRTLLRWLWAALEKLGQSDMVELQRFDIFSSVLWCDAVEASASCTTASCTQYSTIYL